MRLPPKTVELLAPADRLSDPKPRPPVVPVPPGLTSRVHVFRGMFDQLLPEPHDVPTGQEIVTHSELSTFRDCPLKHQWAYKDRWQKDPAPGSPLARGTTWHALLEQVWGLFSLYPAEFRVANADVMLAAARERVWPMLHDSEGRQDPEQELLEWMLEGHLETYGVEPDYEIVVVERAVQLPIPDPDTRLPTRFHLLGKIDAIIWNRTVKRFELVDHKSAANLSRDQEIDLDDQQGFYQWLLTTAGLDIFRSWRSDSRTQRNVGDRNGTKLQPMEERFRRVPTFRTPVELENIARDLLAAARAAWDTGPRYSAPNPLQCGWKCQFIEPHLLARKGVASVPVLMQDHGFTQGVKHSYYDKEPK